MTSLNELIDTAQLEEVLCYHLFLGNAYHFLGTGLQQCMATLQNVILRAQEKKWSYFIIKSLYSMARLYQYQNQTEAVTTILQLMSSFVKPDESVFINRLVQSSFGDHNYSKSVVKLCCPQSMTLKFGDFTVDLTNKPLLFHLIDLLESFVLAKLTILGHFFKVNDVFFLCHFGL